MLIAFNSLFWSIFVIRSILKNRFRCVMDPYFHIGIYSILFFSGIPSENAPEVGMVLIIGSVMVVLGTIFGRKKFKPERKVGESYTNGRVRSIFLFLCIVFAASYLIYYFKQNPADIIFHTRFFNNSKKNEADSFLWSFRLFPLWGLILGRIWLNQDLNNGRLKALWMSLFLLILVSNYFTGARGDSIDLFLGVLIVDVWQGTNNGLNYLKLRKKFYISFLLASASLMLFLTFHRFEIFSTYSEIFSAVSDSLTNFDTKKIYRDGSITENEDVAYVVGRYLDSPTFLAGIYAQLVNPIPRIYWPDKPMTFGQRLGYERTGKDVMGESWGMTAGIAGEAIYNAGYFGLVVFPFIFGLLFKKIGNILCESTRIEILTTAIFFLSHSYLLIRGEWLVGINMPLYSSVIGIALLKITNVAVCLLFKQKKLSENPLSLLAQK